MFPTLHVVFLSGLIQLPSLEYLETIEPKWFTDSPVFSTKRTSTKDRVTTTGSCAIFSISSTTTTDITTATQTTVRHLIGTVKSTYTKGNHGLPLHILAPVVVVVILVVIVFIILAIVYGRSRYFQKKNLYEENGQNTDLQVYENSVVTSTIEENNVAATEYETFNLINDYTDLTNTTVDSRGYTELQLLRHKNKKEPGSYTELQITAVDSGQDYTTLKTGTQRKTGKYEVDYEEVSSPVQAPTVL